MITCPLCSHQVSDEEVESFDDGIIICYGCGLIISETQNLVSNCGSEEFFQSHRTRYQTKETRSKDRLKKQISNICTVLGLSSIIIESIHIAELLLEKGFNGRCSKAIPPSAIYLAMKKEQKPLPLDLLASISNVPISSFVKCSQKYKSLISDLDPITIIPTYSKLIELYLDQIIKECLPKLSIAYSTSPFILSSLRSLFSVLSKYTLISQGRKPEIFTVSLIYVVLYSSLSVSMPSILVSICNRFQLTKKRIVVCINEIVEFLHSVFSFLELSFKKSSHQLLLYLPSLIKYIPLASYYYEIFHNSVPSSSQAPNGTSISYKIESALNWIKSIKSNAKSDLDYIPDYTDVQIRYLLMNQVDPFTISNLTLDGINSLASSFKAKID